MPTDWTLCSLQRQSAGVMSNDGFRCRDFQPREMSFRTASETPSQTKDCMHGQVVRKMTGDTSKKTYNQDYLGEVFASYTLWESTRQQDTPRFVSDSA